MVRRDGGKHGIRNTSMSVHFCRCSHCIREFRDSRLTRFNLIWNFDRASLSSSGSRDANAALRMQRSQDQQLQYDILGKLSSTGFSQLPMFAPGKLWILKRELQSKLSAASVSHGEASIKLAALLILEWMIDQGGVAEIFDLDRRGMDRICGEGPFSPREFIARLKALGAGAFLTRQDMIQILQCFRGYDIQLAIEAYYFEDCIEHLRNVFVNSRLSEYLYEVLLHVASIAHGWSTRPGNLPGISHWTGWGGRVANRHFQQGVRRVDKKGYRQRNSLKLQRIRKLHAPGRDGVGDISLS